MFKHIVIHPHIQTAEVSILAGIKMEDFVWKLHDFGHSHNTWIKKTRLFSVHLLHPTHTHWPDKTKHRTTTFVFLSLLLESLVSIGSVWDRWSALIYSPVIYIHYAICLPNYDCGREGTGWLTLSFLSSQFLYELSFLAMFQKLVFSPTLLCWSLSLSIHLQPGVTQPLIYLWYRCPRVTKTLNLLTKIWKLCRLSWSLSLLVFNMHTLDSHTGPCDESEAGETHSALNVGEVHRAEDWRGGLQDQPHSSVCRDQKRIMWMVDQEGRVLLPHYH